MDKGIVIAGDIQIRIADDGYKLVAA
ncbi:MAG: hypothetical protein ABIJ40_13920 [Bacteroidota bacterium]